MQTEQIRQDEDDSGDRPFPLVRELRAYLARLFVAARHAANIIDGISHESTTAPVVHTNARHVDVVGVSLLEVRLPSLPAHICTRPGYRQTDTVIYTFNRFDNRSLVFVRRCSLLSLFNWIDLREWLRYLLPLVVRSFCTKRLSKTPVAFTCSVGLLLIYFFLFASRIYSNVAKSLSNKISRNFVIRYIMCRLSYSSHDLFIRMCL